MIHVNQCLSQPCHRVVSLIGIALEYLCRELCRNRKTNDNNYYYCYDGPVGALQS